MLVQHPDLPLFPVIGEYYPLSSPSSTFTQSRLSGALFALPLTTTVLRSNQPGLTSPVHFCRLYTSNRSIQSAQHSFTTYINPPDFNIRMPRHSQPKANQDAECSAFPAPLAPIAAGKKRGASVVSRGNLMTSTPGVSLNSNDQPPLRLPPKLKEAERMMHVQRWVNHLPIPAGGSCSNWTYANLQGYRHFDEDRELTPPSSRNYLSSLPFTPEEEQMMIRFFSPPSDYRHNQASAALQIPYSSNQPHISYHAQRTSALHQTTANQHLASSMQQADEVAATGGTDIPPCIPQCKPGAHHRPEADGPGCSRFFAEWETRLISRLFHEYFPGRPEPMGNAGTLPSVGEVRSRIATSRLKDTRTPTAIRAKIKRMQSSGTWIEYQ